MPRSACGIPWHRKSNTATTSVQVIELQYEEGRLKILREFSYQDFRDRLA